MHIPRTKRLLGAATAASVLGLCVPTGAALASPPSQVTPTTFVTAELTESLELNHDRIKFQTKDPATVRVQELVFAPGGFTGFHYHPGVVIVSVKTGSLNHVDGSDCSTVTYNAGDVFVEGSDHAHQAVAPEGATVYVTYIVPGDYSPAAEKYRVEAPIPFCASSL